MLKRIFVLIVLIIVIAVGWNWYAGQGGTTSTPALNAALYPLYSSAQWSKAHEKVATDGPGYEIVSNPFTDVTDIGAVSTPFTKYYLDKLTAAGWAPDMSREAGGPGAEVSYYTKGDQFIIVSFHSDFKVKHPDAPSECPCDVTLSLMSGTQVGQTAAQEQATHMYHDIALGFSITLPTALATSSNDSLWSVDSAYEYQAQGPGKSIAGVKFTIPKTLAVGTNLSNDSYVSVEHLKAGEKCDASTFMMDPSIKSHSVQEGVLSYSVATSSDAAVGNRYEETVYARTDSSSCIAVRYFIHYAAIQNYPDGAVKEFDKAALLQTFDQIRRTLAISQ